MAAAKKPSSSSNVAPKGIAKKPAPAPVATTPVRNTPIPKVAAAAAVAAPKVITRDQIAVRAFEISCGPNCGSEVDNWFRAERELRAV